MQLQAAKKGRKQRALSDSSSSNATDTELDGIMSLASSDNDEEFNTQCRICQKKYGSDKKGEAWVRCTVRFEWVHEVCSSENPRKKNFACDFCA